MNQGQVCICLAVYRHHNSRTVTCDTYEMYLGRNCRVNHRQVRMVPHKLKRCARLLIRPLFSLSQLVHRRAGWMKRQCRCYRPRPAPRFTVKFQQNSNNATASLQAHSALSLPHHFSFFPFFPSFLLSFYFCPFNLLSRAPSSFDVQHSSSSGSSCSFFLSFLKTLSELG